MFSSISSIHLPRVGRDRGETSHTNSQWSNQSFLRNEACVRIPGVQETLQGGEPMETLKGEYPNSRNGSSKSLPPYFALYYLLMGFSSILIKISFNCKLGRSPGGGNSNPLHYSCLGNPTDRGAWWATVWEVTDRQTWLNTYTQINQQQSVNYFPEFCEPF